MIYQELILEEAFPELPETGVPTRIRFYAPDLSPVIDPERKNPCVIVCPGGGYAFLSDREGEPLALRLVSYGIAAIVIDYAITPVRYPMQLLEVAGTVALARKRAAEWHLDPYNITVMGFSAGGHAAAAAGILWRENCISRYLGVDNTLCRPDGMILGYPVITTGEHCDWESIDNLLGEFKCLELLEKVSLEKQVDPSTPPAFIWHTRDDQGVSIENSVGLMTALCKNGIGFEAHIYPHGKHGLSLSDYTTDRFPSSNDVTNWIGMAVCWIRTIH